MNQNRIIAIVSFVTLKVFVWRHGHPLLFCVILIHKVFKHIWQLQHDDDNGLHGFSNPHYDHPKSDDEAVSSVDRKSSDTTSVEGTAAWRKLEIRYISVSNYIFNLLYNESNWPGENLSIVIMAIMSDNNT